MAMRRGKLSTVLASPKLAIWLMLYLGVYAFLGTLVPQGRLSAPRVAEWIASHPTAEKAAQLFGMHNAYTSFVFLIPAALLAASTAVCSWGRTTVALRRYRALAQVRRGTVGSVTLKPTLTLTAADKTPEEALEAVEAGMRSAGLRPRRSVDAVVAGSAPWIALGSPVFHWSLVFLMVVLGIGSLFRADGLMGIPVGQTVPNSADSYGVMTAGPLHTWSGQPLIFGVDKFDLTYVINGLDRGPTPTVAIRSADGKTVLARQPVYPNNPLKYGSLIVHPSDYGLAATFALVDPKGADVSRSGTLIDFNDKSPIGTDPGEITLTNSSGQVGAQVTVTIPVARKNGVVAHLLPKSPVAVLRVANADGSDPQTSTVSVGQAIAFPDGAKLRLVSIDYYARLNVVDDVTVPVLYAALILCLLGAAVAVLGTQRAVVATAKTAEDGATVVEVAVRNWRNGGSAMIELPDALRDALGDEDEEGSGI